jgi:hypothetical protein
MSASFHQSQSAMTVHAPNLPTAEELASRIEVAVSAPDVTIPPARRNRIVALGHVALTAKGPLVTRDGLIRFTESE